jgi:DNA-binding NarL/FixJ family response regulator
MKNAIRILLVDDHATVRNGLAAAIANQSDLLLVGEAATWSAALESATNLRPDVLVLDLNLPDGDGWSLLEQLRDRGTLPATLVLSACDEHMYARRLLRSGARGYLMKDEPLSRIIEAIRQVHQGMFVASQTVTNELMQIALEKTDATSKPWNDGGIGTLSDRELQIFSCLGQGWRNKEIAQRLNVTEKTVSTYKTRLMGKLGISSSMELLDYYRKSQLKLGAGPQRSL